MPKLKEYKKKRDFTKTSEPAGAIEKMGKKTKFVIQKHKARRLHYDFRIEDEGVLKSWAVPKEPSMSKKDKRLAVHVEDHPLDYGNFEGIIAKGNYGAGSVEIWDKGYFVNMTIKDGKVEPLAKWIKEGHFLVWLKGDRLRGGFAFQRLKKDDDKNWLLIKMNDEEALENKKDEEGIVKTLNVKDKEIEITNSNKEIFANITKGNFVEYYKFIAPIMLKHVENRPISMFRFPHGLRQEGFFQKHVPDYFPKWMKRVEVTRKGKKIKYIMANDEPSIVYLATQVIIPHIWPSRHDKIEYPDKMIFDLDPQVPDFGKTQQVALDVRKFLDQLGMPSFIMTSGNKGYHIAVPTDRTTKQEEVKAFAGKIASVLANHYSETITDEMRIEKREDKVFIDTYRNSVTHTAVAPYSVRASLRGGIACPIGWDEVKKIRPHDFTLDNIEERIKKKDDIWNDFWRETISVEKIKSNLKR
jgi:bifunctional non-homologous end joining protein LigD